MIKIKSRWLAAVSVLALATGALAPVVATAAAAEAAPLSDAEQAAATQLATDILNAVAALGPNPSANDVTSAIGNVVADAHVSKKVKLAALAQVRTRTNDPVIQASVDAVATATAAAPASGGPGGGSPIGGDEGGTQSSGSGYTAPQ